MSISDSIMCIYVLWVCLMPMEVQRRHSTLYNWSFRCAMSVPGAQPKFTAGAARVLHFWAISPASCKTSFNKWLWEDKMSSCRRMNLDLPYCKRSKFPNGSRLDTRPGALKALDKMRKSLRHRHREELSD